MVAEPRSLLAALLAALGLIGLSACQEAAPTTTPTPSASATPRISATPSPSPTSSPTPHPLAITGMRSLAYPGSDFELLEALPPGNGYQQSVVAYRSEGLAIHALLTVPEGEPPPGGWPAVAFNHGYIAPSVYRTTERYVAYVDYFARGGYVVLKSDYRGHGSSEGEARGGYGSPDYTIDVLNGLASLRRMPEVDSSRLGMWGHSMGGHITLRSMVITDSIKAGVIWAGVVPSYPDLLSRWNRRRPIPTGIPPRARRWRDDLLDRHGPPVNGNPFWDGISANSFLSDLSGPLQLHHGSADATVPLEWSETLQEQVAAVGRSSEIFVYQGDDHNLSANLFTALERSRDFFDAALAEP